MKVLMIAPQPFFEPRGTPISIYQRVQGLSALGYEVDLLTYPLGQDTVMQGLRICRIPKVPFIKEIRIGPSWPKLCLDSVLFFQAVWMMLRRRYDVIHSHEEGAFMALVLAALFRTPHLYDMHSSLPRQLGNSRYGHWRPIVRAFEMLEDRVLRSARVVVTIGQDLEEYVLAKYPQANHLRIENTPIKPTVALQADAGARLRSKLGLDGRLLAVYTGNFEHYQGLELLLASMRLLAERQPEAALVMVGGQPQQIAHWQAEAERLGVRDRIVFAGTVALDEAVAYLELADILVSPRTTGLSTPLKLYSYLHSGKPIVATRIQAHCQLLRDDMAVITDATPEAFAAGIARLAQDGRLRREIGKKAEAFAAEFCSPSSYLAKLLQAYQSIVTARPIAQQPTPRPGVEGAQRPA